MIYGSVCSGIEAATVAWRPLGWQCAFVSEIDQFPCAVLKHHYPEVINYGDFTKIGRRGKRSAIDLLVGGTPCQSFSVAGLRKGMADPRGNLALEYLALVKRLRPAWVVWENVAGVLSSNEGRDFGAFLWALGKLGYGFAYRMFDAQYFGVPQRRRRIFVVGHSGDWRRAAAVLFERHSLQGNLAPRREARQAVASTISARTKGGGGLGTDFDCDDGSGRGTPIVPTLTGNGDSHSGYRDAQALVAAFHGGQGAKAGSIAYAEECAPTLKASASGSNRSPSLLCGLSVRRLTPRECERLQGFPDDYTLITRNGKPTCDGPRYKALGNSMAVPVMRWIGERIQMVNQEIAC